MSHERSSRFIKWAAAGALAVVALGSAAVANANGVSWSVGVSAPGVVLGVGQPAPVYYAPAPAYYAPAPTYYAPPPVYYRPPPPVYYRPAPVYYGPPAPVYYGPGPGYWRHHRHHGHHGGWR